MCKDTILIDEVRAEIHLPIILLERLLILTRMSKNPKDANTFHQDTNLYPILVPTIVEGRFSNALLN